MQTSKIISAISYNTPDFLKGKLYTLVRQGIIEYAHWIWHEPEKDETKSHAHLLLKPNKRLDTSALRNEFIEQLPGEELPRKVLPFVNSKITDWILYAVHDTVYLTKKCQSRVHQYTQSDIHTTEPDLLLEHWKEAHEGEDSRMKLVIELAEKGAEWRDILKMGVVPPNQLFAYREVFFTFIGKETQRNGKAGHE
jgi:hypothetical protein